MPNIKTVFAGYSVNNIQQAQEFYSDVLGLKAEIDPNMGTLDISINENSHVFLYPKENHQAATFTVLNLIVENIDEAVDELMAKGIKFERYDGFNQDSKGIARTTDPSKGPSIAWLTDPSGNIISIIEA
jgi:catechol 2,3-dioxygenase-like lactoylglutathione lyase family enzyme